MTENRTTVKVFTGCKLNSELRMHLNQSKSWSQASILSPAERAKNNHLLEVHYQGKEYIGKYLPGETIALSELKKAAIQVKENIKIYCPQYNIDLLKFCIFPQLFIA